MENVLFTHLVNCVTTMACHPCVQTGVPEDAHAVNFLVAVLDRELTCWCPSPERLGGRSDMHSKMRDSERMRWAAWCGVSGTAVGAV